MNGIRTNKSRPCLDFGLSSAFYVSESAEDAIDWGVKNSDKWHDEVAILVFHLPHNFHNEFDFKDLSKNVEEWKWVVTSFRDCKEVPEILEYDDAYDFMYGPMMSNPWAYTTEGVKTHRIPVMQLAAKTREATRFLHRHMKGAFIFRKRPQS